MKKVLGMSAIASLLLGFGLTASAQTAQQQAPVVEGYYGAPCMMGGYYGNVPVNTNYPVMMGYYCPYHGYYHYRPVFITSPDQYQPVPQQGQTQPQQPQQAQQPQNNAPAQQ